MSQTAQFQGRAAASNPANRFERFHLEPDLDAEGHEGQSGSGVSPLHLQPDPNAEDREPGERPPAPATQFFKDHSTSILTHNDSPDVGFDTSINPYRGCEHGCIYCYARPTHEYLGFSAGLDFESKIMVKADAPSLLRREMASPRWKPRVVAMSGVTDCYQPAEKRLRLTRGCLEVLAECRNPVTILTKNFLVTRDLEPLQELARHQAVSVYISVTTLQSDLARVMEPRTSMPRQRLAAIATLARAGVPVGVMVAPVIPGLTDHEILSIIDQATRAGARFAGYTVVRLPFAVKDLFEDWLATHAPGQKDKVLNRIRALRDGKLNDSNFGSRMSGAGIFADQIAQTFALACRKAGIADNRPLLSVASFRRPLGRQLTLL